MLTIWDIRKIIKFSIGAKILKNRLLTTEKMKKKKSFFPLTWSTKKDMLDWTSIDPSEIYWIVSFGK
jgi:hypothetical protein